MARALALYQRTKLRKQTRVNRSEAGEGDDEGTRLGPRAGGVLAVEVAAEMRADGSARGIAAHAVWLPAAGNARAAWAGAEREVFWLAGDARDAHGAAERLMDRMDAAAAVVVYGTALERVASTWDQARRTRHREKTIDVEREVARQAGRTQRLATVARVNGGKGKAGAGCDAGGLWRAGRWEDIERSTRRDAEVIATLSIWR